MKPSKIKIKAQDGLTLEELYNDFNIIPGYDESKECYYLEDPDTDEYLTPCLPNEYELMDWVNEHWDEIGERLIEIKEKIQHPGETDKANGKLKTGRSKKINTA